MVGAWVLRLVDLTRFPAWEDEALTWWLALQYTSGHELIERMSAEPTPPLHYVLIGVLLRLCGDSDLVMRLPSTIFGALGVGAVYGLGRSVAGARVGWWAALWLTFHPWHISFSREARAYAWLALMTTLVAWTLWRALERPDTKRLGAFAGCLAVACWVHFYALFVGFTAGVAILLLGDGLRDRTRLLTAAAIAGLLFAPYVAVTLPGLVGGGSDWLVERLYQINPAAAQPLTIAEGHAIGAVRTPFARLLAQPPTPPLLQRPAVAAQAVLALLGLLVPAIAGRRRVFLLLFGLLPVALPWLISVSYRPILHLGRHDFLVLPLVGLWIGAGWEALRSGFGLPRLRTPGRVGAALLLLAILPGAAFRLAWMHLLPTPDGPRPLAVQLARDVPEDGLIVATGIRRLSVERYLRLAGSRATIESFPRSTDGHPGWADPRDLVRRQDELRREAAERVGSWTHQRDRLWVLPRAYPSTDAERRRSEEWLIDRHLFDALEAAGYRSTTPSAELDVLRFDREPH